MMISPDDMSDEEHRRWTPPLSDSWFYFIDIDIDGESPVRFSATVPNQEMIEFASAVLGRIGGASSRDWSFRRELYFYIGLATVAGGKIEAAMKRAILIGQGESSAKMSKVDENWSTLEKKLRRVASKQIATPSIADGWGEAVEAAINWGADHRAKERRDNIVHAYWWDWADTNCTRGRFFRRGESTTIGGSLEQLRKDGEALLTYAQMLEELSGPYWFNLYLPRENNETEEDLSSIKWTRAKQTPGVPD